MSERNYNALEGNDGALVKAWTQGVQLEDGAPPGKPANTSRRTSWLAETWPINYSSRWLWVAAASSPLPR